MRRSNRTQTRRSLKSHIDIDWTLKKVFRKRTFKPLQREVICSALDGYDIFVQAATGFGKSLCYQLPAVIGHGITIVVSPLLALMTDQIAALSDADVEVATINSNTPMEERDLIKADLRCGHPKIRLLYVTPEYCLSETFRSCLILVHKQKELSRIAIDEAHCISEWGHDFRPAYKMLSWFKDMFPSVPMMALTATATAKVQQDIISTLRLRKLKLKEFSTSTSRPNLHYRVLYTSDSDDRFNTFLNWIQAVYARRSNDPTRAAELVSANAAPRAVCGIIYATSRQQTEDLAQLLRSHDIRALAYHAKLPVSVREEAQRKWLRGDDCDIMVATTAFGMGIDKASVRFVVHWSLPKSFEAFYQEAGRAGRDGKAAACLLFYSREDKMRAGHRLVCDFTANGNPKNRSKLEERLESLDMLANYCESEMVCRHELIARYFGEQEKPECDYACDVCLDGSERVRERKSALTDCEWARKRSNADVHTNVL